MIISTIELTTTFIFIISKENKNKNLKVECDRRLFEKAEEISSKCTRGWRRYSPLRVRLAEWSKASVLRADGGNVAWVRIPHLANYFYLLKYTLSS